MSKTQNALKIDMAKTNDVREYELNNKLHDEADIEKLSKSILEFGWTQPIAVDENGVILAGHRRLAAAKKLNLPEVPVVRLVGLSDVQKKHYRIADNRLSSVPNWNFEALQVEIQFLEQQGIELETFDLETLKIDEDSSGAKGGAGGGGVGVNISYNLVFDDTDQQDAWFNFIRQIKIKYPEAQTIAQRIVLFLNESGVFDG